MGLSTISVPKQENADVTLVLNNVQRLQCLHFKGNSERGRSHIPLVELKAHTQEEMRYSAIGDFFQETSYQSRFMRSYFICPQNQILLSTKYGLGTVFRTKQKKKKKPTPVLMGAYFLVKVLFTNKSKYIVCYMEIGALGLKGIR